MGEWESGSEEGGFGEGEAFPGGELIEKPGGGCAAGEEGGCAGGRLGEGVGSFGRCNFAVERVGEGGAGFVECGAAGGEFGGVTLAEGVGGSGQVADERGGGASLHGGQL